jgi:hypothetical protein
MSHSSITIYTLLIILTLLVSCSQLQDPSEIQNHIKEVKKAFVPDSRVDKFDISIEQGGGSHILKGETTLLKAKQVLIDTLNHLGIQVKDEIAHLPTQEIGGEKYALINNSVSNLRSSPRHSAQLITQSLLGMPLQVLKKEGGWYYVRTPEDYLGWIDAGGIHRIDEPNLNSWNDSEKIIFTNTYGFSFLEPTPNAHKVSDLVTGNILRLSGSTGNFYEVLYPDGRTAYINKTNAQPFDEWNENLEASRNALVNTAYEMMGIPYLWGGTSTKGVDCSGFTKTIYLMNGLIIPRDASQQVHAGELIDNAKNWDMLEAGDLLFFGSEATSTSSRRVVHVGMWIGDNEFIHSSRQVRISSVDPNAENYDQYNTNRYLEARRYIGNSAGNIIKANNMYTDIKF